MLNLNLGINLGNGAIPVSIALAIRLLCGAWLDYCIGDPWRWYHPVQAIGAYISRYSQWAIAATEHPRSRRWLGLGLMLTTIGGAAALAAGLSWMAHGLNAGLGWAIDSIMLAASFAGRSLRDAAEDVLTPLTATPPDLGEARSRLIRYVGRDTEDLNEAEILRAVLETIAENTVDGVTAPLFWAIIGAMFGAIVTLPALTPAFVWGYKAASTLDSMVGYRREPYTDLGFFSARTEDGLTWLPCRFTVVAIAMLSQQPRAIWQGCQQEARLDPSPNSGWSECAYAIALGVQLGGENRYQGEIRSKPHLGKPHRLLSPTVCRAGLVLMRRCFLWGLVIGCGAIGVVGLL